MRSSQTKMSLAFMYFLVYAGLIGLSPQKELFISQIQIDQNGVSPVKFLQGTSSLPMSILTALAVNQSIYCYFLPISFLKKKCYLYIMAYQMFI